MATKKTAPAKTADFENSLKKLEALVARMEEGNMSLEESLKAFEEGVRLTRLCQETLVEAQQKVQQLTEKQGKVSLQDISAEDEDA